jgi:hypothetical protein
MEGPIMVSIDDRELCNVTGGRRSPASLGRIPGTTIYSVPSTEAVCNREQFDWMAARVGNGVAPHVVAADAKLCGFPMPGSRPAEPTITTASAEKFLGSMSSMNLDFFSFLR